VLRGYGNNRAAGPSHRVDGVLEGAVLGTYLHGPVLVRNPDLADLLLSFVAGRLPPLAGREEHWTQSLRDQRLAAVTAEAP
jgi:CobQ-like glutamine amidotransferase family enzyme